MNWPARVPGRTLVTLTSVSDDDLGEELTVVWEVEPGREIVPATQLPQVTETSWDDPQTLGAFLDAVRWGTVASADAKTLQAPFRSGIMIEEYQLEPVARALAMPRVNLLIADDVGLGKTIEAGLVVQEMLLRHRARRVIVVCPASLTLKWQEEMDAKFGSRLPDPRHCPAPGTQKKPRPRSQPVRRLPADDHQPPVAEDAAGPAHA